MSTPRRQNSDGASVSGTCDKWLGFLILGGLQLVPANDSVLVAKLDAFAQIPKTVPSHTIVIEFQDWFIRHASKTPTLVSNPSQPPFLPIAAALNHGAGPAEKAKRKGREGKHECLQDWESPALHGRRGYSSGLIWSIVASTCRY